MSFNAQSKAWNIELKGSPKYVLLCLADHADDSTLEAFPSIARICKRTGLNKKTVMSCLAQLEKLGVIQTLKKFGAGNTYKLNLDWQPVPKTVLDNSTDDPKNESISSDSTSTEIGTGTNIGPVPKTVPDQYQNRDLTSTNIGTLISHESINNQLTNNIGAVKGSAPKESKKRKTQLPENFSITPLMNQWAEKNAPGTDPVSETEKFKDYHTAKGSTFADWVAAWRTWMRNAASFSKRSYSPPRQQAVNQSRHSGFENIDYRNGLTENPDGSFSF